MIKIITIQNKLEWTSCVRMAAEYDFYHTWHYNSLETSGIPGLFVYQEEQDFIAFPFIKRNIPGSVYFDISSVYGYSGPLSNKHMADLDNSLMEAFKTAFLKFLSDENCVSVFSRMHPFYKQDLLLDKFGGVHDNGLTLVIDLSESIEEQRKKYYHSTMAAIKQAWKKGYRFVEETGPEAIAVFFEIYSETMRRVGAAEYYLFNEKYFAQILNTDEYNARLFMIYDGDIVMTSSIIMFTNGIIQAHLVGTRSKYLVCSPTKFLVDEVTKIGRLLGMRYYNLGGGVGYKEDNVFKWKCAFTDLKMEYKSWRYVVNPVIYQQLLNEKGIDENADVDFFPLYRYA